MRTSFSMLWIAIFFAGWLALLDSRVPNSFQATKPAGSLSHNYLGFDRNRYPGDAVLGLLRETLSFCGYWLNVPSGETSNTWEGKRGVLNSSGFGFLLLFNERFDRELKSLSNSKTLGTHDAAVAVEAAKKEGFPVGTIIFLDQEEGGRMLPEQRAYVYAWIDGVMPLGIEPVFIVPGSLQEKQAEQQSSPRTIYKITLTEGKSSFSFTTIRALHRPVVPFQEIRHHRNRVASRLRRSGNLLSHLADENSRPYAHPSTTPMAIATRHYYNQPMASISISILQIHQIHLLADAECLATHLIANRNVGQRSQQLPVRFDKPLVFLDSACLTTSTT
jgi:hypothetical protein